MQTAPQHNTPEYSVSEISGALKRVVEDTFFHVRIRGEVSGYRGPHSSGHCYFALKDDKAKIDAIIWKGVFGKINIKPEEGMEVIATGRLSTYPGKSGYQVIIEHIEPAGVGALLAQLEMRKKQLAAEGLFSPERKKPLPFMPQTIGVVTSPTGAVIRDILHRISDRFPCHVLVWPVKVQGEGAAEEIAAALRGFNNATAIAKPDVLIVARGGGSLEDLWCFNEEIVARAVADSAIPIISAVGHETDTTLIDYVSDQRAPTPTAAAELAVPVRDEWVYAVEQRGLQLQQQVRRRMQMAQQQLEGMARGLLHPARLLENTTQRLDGWAERLQSALPKRIEQHSIALTHIGARLQPSTIKRSMVQSDKELARLGQGLQTGYMRRLQQLEDKLNGQIRLMDSLNYTQVLKRGFAIARSLDGAVIGSSEDAKAKGVAQLQFHDGEMKLEAVAPKVSKKKKASMFSDDQGALF